jgi:hypothetical protein
MSADVNLDPRALPALYAPQADASRQVDQSTSSGTLIMHDDDYGHAGKTARAPWNKENLSEPTLLCALATSCPSGRSFRSLVFLVGRCDGSSPRLADITEKIAAPASLYLPDRCAF